MLFQLTADKSHGLSCFVETTAVSNNTRHMRLSQEKIRRMRPMDHCTFRLVELLCKQRIKGRNPSSQIVSKTVRSMDRPSHGCFTRTRLSNDVRILRLWKFPMTIPYIWNVDGFVLNPGMIGMDMEHPEGFKFQIKFIKKSRMG